MEQEPEQVIQQLSSQTEIPPRELNVPHKVHHFITRKTLIVMIAFLLIVILTGVSMYVVANKAEKVDPQLTRSKAQTAVTLSPTPSPAEPPIKSPYEVLADIQRLYPKEITWGQINHFQREFLFYDENYNMHELHVASYTATGGAMFSEKSHLCSPTCEAVYSYLEDNGWEDGKFAADGHTGSIRQFVKRTGETIQLLDVEYQNPPVFGPSIKESPCPCDTEYSISISEPFTPSF